MYSCLVQCVQCERQYCGSGTHFRCSFKELNDDFKPVGTSIDMYVQIGYLLPIVGGIYSLNYGDNSNLRKV